MSCPVWIKNYLNYYKEKQTCVVKRLNVRWLLTKMTDHSSATSFLEFSVLFPRDLDLHTVSIWLTDRSGFMAKFTNPNQFGCEENLLSLFIKFCLLFFHFQNVGPAEVQSHYLSSYWISFARSLLSVPVLVQRSWLRCEDSSNYERVVAGKSFSVLNSSLTLE